LACAVILGYHINCLIITSIITTRSAAVTETANSTALEIMGTKNNTATVSSNLHMHHLS